MNLNHAKANITNKNISLGLNQNYSSMLTYVTDTYAITEMFYLPLLT